LDAGVSRDKIGVELVVFEGSSYIVLAKIDLFVGVADSEVAEA
jgi:hypothetical protein